MSSKPGMGVTTANVRCAGHCCVKQQRTRIAREVARNALAAARDAHKLLEAPRVRLLAVPHGQPVRNGQREASVGHDTQPKE